jgi:23S rRNA (cytidine1920-2'-O)/16S rRNA (cytidine1409-2'-O)-methyltransferase
MTKKRLDIFVNTLYQQYSRKQIQLLIAQGNVFVDGIAITKSSTQISNKVIIELRDVQIKYVGRSGFKLEKALEYFRIDVTNLVCLDAGLSTGGFTDCLLQHGVKKVYGIDVGHGQVHQKISDDERVVIHEHTNLRHLQTVGEYVDLITLDLSFISVLKVIDTVKRVLRLGGKLIILIKPQFEVERKDVGRGGIIKDEKIHKKVINNLLDKLKKHGFTSHGVVDSPIKGGSGNKEFLGYFTFE